MKGVYVLVISVSKDIQIDVGSLGSMNFSKGVYAYVGSAQKSFEKRVKRHLRKDKRKFWHIDYLLGNDAAEVLKVFHKEAGKHEECIVAKKINKRGVPIRAFGSSDCKCESHLTKMRDDQFLCLSKYEGMYDLQQLFIC
jgi:Uri superfamily endonuclease